MRSSDTLTLRNPDNWCPIEQDYFDNTYAFRLPHPLPYRVSLKSGTTSRTLRTALSSEQHLSSDTPEAKRPIFTIPGGAAQLYDIPLSPAKPLRSLTLRTLANDVVVGLMSITLQRKEK